MAFTTVFDRSYRWRPETSDGLEHCRIYAQAHGVVADGVVIGGRGGRAYGIRYRIDCGPDWRVRRFAVEDCSGLSLTMTSDGSGDWFDGEGRPLPTFFGAVDIDLSGSPFTNTLPIRRFSRQQTGASETFRMVYVPFATLQPDIDEQCYTCLEPYRRYRYEAVDRSFAAELSVDEAGIVGDYPTLFRRMPLDAAVDTAARHPTTDSAP